MHAVLCCMLYAVHVVLIVIVVRSSTYDGVAIVQQVLQNVVRSTSEDVLVSTR